MFRHEIHGSLGMTIVSIWVVTLLVLAAAYGLWRVWRRTRRDVPPPMKYSKQLRQRVQKMPRRKGAAAIDNEDSAHAAGHVENKKVKHPP